MANQMLGFSPRDFAEIRGSDVEVSLVERCWALSKRGKEWLILHAHPFVIR